MNWLMIGAIIQGVTLLVLASTVYVAYRQLKAATEQARASEAQAKSSEQMAHLSLEQTHTMRAQLHASLRPFLEVSGEYGPNSANLVLKNVGIGPALGVLAIYRGGYRHNLGSLSSEQTATFRFDNSLNHVPQPVGSRENWKGWEESIQPVPLRLEYRSVSGARCWTNVKFPLGHEGAVEPELVHGMEEPFSGIPA